jgi:hypothetical protein
MNKYENYKWGMNTDVGNKIISRIVSMIDEKRLTWNDMKDALYELSQCEGFKEAISDNVVITVKYSCAFYLEEDDVL